MDKLKPEYIFEASWEVCNMVGGIYTVLSTRALTLQRQFGDNLIFIGPDIWKDTSCSFFEENPKLYATWKKFTLDEFGLPIRIGRWKIPGQPIAVLVNFQSLMSRKNDIFAQVWDWAGVNSLYAYGDYDEASMFGYASGIVIQSYHQFFKLSEFTPIIAHFNEWMTTFGQFYIQKEVPSIATVFTTHATSIGRSIAGNNKPLYGSLCNYNGDQMSYELNMVSKHSTEKAAAHLADCFSTVSQITAMECAQLLDKVPDSIIPNGFEADFVPSDPDFELKRTEARVLLKKVAETLLSYAISDDCIFVGTSGRYEFKNKGIDVFIQSLHKLKERSSELQKEIIAFIMVPAHIGGVRSDLSECLKKDSLLQTDNRFTTHHLNDYNNDLIMNLVRSLGFANSSEEQIKIIFVPSYLNGSDGIFDKTYYDLLIGLDLTIFPSYYEPWGYTPLESIAFSVPTVTTDLSGFGRWASEFSAEIEKGVAVIGRTDYNNEELINQIASTIVKFASFSPKKINTLRNKVLTISKKALWKKFISYYFDAYHLALSKRNKRIS